MNLDTDLAHAVNVGKMTLKEAEAKQAERGKPTKEKGKATAKEAAK